MLHENLRRCEKFFRADCPIDLGHIDLLPVLFHVYPFRGRLTFWKLPSVVRQKTRIVKNGDEIRQKENHFDPEKGNLSRKTGMLSVLMCAVVKYHDLGVVGS
jgi:hypothetical protein